MTTDSPNPSPSPNTNPNCDPNPNPNQTIRTNTAGINVLMECFPDMPVTTVDIRGCDSLHLKSACSMAGHSHIIFGGEVGEYISKVVARECTFLYENTTFVPDMEVWFANLSPHPNPNPTLINPEPPI